MSNENLLLMRQEMEELRSLVGGVLATPHQQTGVSHETVDQLKQSVEQLSKELAQLRLSQAKQADAITTHAVKQAKAGVMGVVVGGIEPVVKELVAVEKEARKIVANGLASVSGEVQASKAIAGAHANASRNLLLNTINNFCRS